MFAFTIGVSIYPDHFLTGTLGMWGTVFILLKNPSLRQAIVANPSTVPLNDTGFKLVAAMRNTDKTVAFLKRVITSMRGKVLDTDTLFTYAAYATKGGKPNAGYRDLCADLKKLVEEKLGEHSKMVSFLDQPLEEKTLVKSVYPEIAYGEIVRCTNKDVKRPEDTYKYEVSLSKKTTTSKTHAEETRGQSPSASALALSPRYANTKDASELQLRTDLRWLSNPAVLALIPDSVETTIMSFLPTLDSVRKSFLSIATSLEDLFGWKSNLSLIVCVGLYTLSLICFLVGAWVEKLIFVSITVFVFFSSTRSWTIFVNRRRGAKLAAEHKKHAGEHWGFLKDVDSPSPPSSSRFQQSAAQWLEWCGLGKKKTT
jgi:hypothetical protein